MKIKVAIIYHYLASYRLPIFQELMKSEDVEYTIYSGRDSEIEIKKVEEDYAKLGLDRGGLRWKFVENKWLLKKKFLWQKGIMDLVRNKEYDAFIFLGSSFHLSTWVGSLLARLKGKKVYYWMHGVYRDKLSAFDYIKMYLFYRLPHGYFLYGNRASGIIKQHNKKYIDRSFVVYNSLNYEGCLELRKTVDSDDILRFRTKYFQDASLPVVCFIGRLNSVKRIDLLIEAQRKLLEKYGRPVYNIFLIGDGAEKDALAQQAASNGLSGNIYFAGPVYEESEISKVLMHADVCVTPGEVGLTAIHAMSYGTPAISHDNLNVQMPEVEAIQAGATGNLFAYNDVDALVAVLEEWFKQYPVKDRQIAENCKKVIDEYYNPRYQARVFNSVLTGKEI